MLHLNRSSLCYCLQLDNNHPFSTLKNPFCSYCVYLCSWHVQDGLHLRGFYVCAIVFAGDRWWLNSSKWNKVGIYSTSGLARIWLCLLDVFLVNKYLNFIFCYEEFWTFDIVIEPDSTSHNCNFCFLNWLALLKQSL